MSAAEMTSAFRDFALKKFSEAKQRGATLATATAATAASITSSVPVPVAATSFVFRSTGNQGSDKEPLSLEKKQVLLRESNIVLKKRAADHPIETLEYSIGKIDLINESLAFTIDNIQECSHVFKMMNRQLRELSSLNNPGDADFYKQRQTSAVSSVATPHDDPL